MTVVEISREKWSRASNVQTLEGGNVRCVNSLKTLSNLTCDHPIQLTPGSMKCIKYQSGLSPGVRQIQHTFISSNEQFKVVSGDIAN